ncbi:MAG: VWA domain-containing protein [Lentisphaerae bacterium]|nr:VWA domain-containing protein [Lentisphaerota bacterium]
MQFLNIAMLLGLLTVSIPIIIHLLNRRSPKKIEWGAMMFLLESMRRNQRRVLIEDILLLGCRCLLLALAALAFARPFVTPDSSVPWVVVMPLLLISITLFGISFALWRHPKWKRRCFSLSLFVFALIVAVVVFERHLNLRRFGRGALKDVVIIVDGSTSMYMEVDGVSNFARACDETLKYINEAPRGTAFSIIIGGPVPRILNPAPVSEKRILYDTVERLTPSSGTMQVPAVLTAAAMTLAAGNNGAKQIVIVGDGQAVGWGVGDVGRWKNIKRLFDQLPNNPPVIWRTLPLPGSIRNLAIEDVSLSRDVVGVDRDVGIRVTVRNTGSEAVTPDEVSVETEGAFLVEKNVDQLEPGASATFVFRHKFTQPGTVLLTAKVVSEDDLPADDEFKYVVPVMDKLRVLVVDGESSSGDIFAKSSTFISLALRPDIPIGGPAEGENELEASDFLVETDVEPLHKVLQREDFGEYAVVVLADVPRLPKSVLDALANHCALGGGLFILPNAGTQAEAFNDWKHGNEPVIPLKLGKWKSADSATASSRKMDTSVSRIDTASFNHDMLRNVHSGSDLGMVTPLQYWTIDEDSWGIGNVAARLADNSPFLAVKPLGYGTVAMSLFPFDAVISSLPGRSGFVPLVHEIIYYLSKPVSADLNIRPSEGATLLLAPHGAGAGVMFSWTGLSGSYYNNEEWKGVPTFTRVDENINFNWKNGSPDPSIAADRFSIMWVGSIVPEKSGKYTFSFDADDWADVEIDGKPGVIYGGEHVKHETFSLQGGKAYSVRVRFKEGTGWASVKFFWSIDGADRVLVPAGVFHPTLPKGTEEDDGKLVSILDPHRDVFQGELARLELGTSLKISRGLVPGVYEVFPPSTIPSTSDKTDDGRLLFSVISGIEESSIEAMTTSQTEFISQYIPLSQAAKTDDVLSALRGEAFGREMWRFLAFGALVFLVVEVWITRWISIRRRTGEEEKVDFSNEGPGGTDSFRESLAMIREQP